jgi:glycerol uptake facilitator-like aquaporin
MTHTRPAKIGSAGTAQPPEAGIAHVALRRRAWSSEFIGTIMLLLTEVLLVHLLFSDSSAIAREMPGPVARSATIGAATGVLITVLIVSPLGRRSGGHFNPAVTAAFWLLRAIPTLDALAYVVAQLLGSVAGVLLGRLILGAIVAGPAVRYAAIQPAPGWSGVMVFTGEAVSAFVLMAVVVYFLTQSQRARWTPAAVGVVVGILIVAGGASSGGSFNPARQFGPALLAHEWRHLVSYLAGPVAGAAVLALIARAVLPPQALNCALCSGFQGPTLRPVRLDGDRRRSTVTAGAPNARSAARLRQDGSPPHAELDKARLQSGVADGSTR